MFLEQNISKENPFWKYVVGSVLILVASIIGQVPLLIVIGLKSIQTGSYPTTNEDILKFLEPNLSLFLILISFVFGLAGLYFVIKYFHRQTFLSVTTSRPKTDWKRIFFAFGLWAVITIVSTAIMYYFEPELFENNFKPIPFLILFVIATILIPFQTSTEEYLFRGYLMQGFAGLAKNRWFPLVMTSVIFGGMHIANPEVGKMGYIIMVYYIGTGLFLGIVTLMDEGMEIALGFHAANNLVSALLITSDWSAFQTHSILKDVSEPKAGIDVIIPVVVIYPILLYVFSKKYKWTNWKEKLTGQIIQQPIQTSNTTQYND